MAFSRMLMGCTAPLALAGCAAGGLTNTAPVTPGQAAPISVTERQQGSEARTGILNEYNGAYTRGPTGYVTNVARRIAVQSGLSSDPGAFTVTVLDSSVDNAFATPGGYVYVTRGLLALMNDEAELAAVLGHEVGHVAARHSQKRQAAAQRNSIFGALGQVLAGAVLGDSGFGQLLGRAAGTGSQLATLGYSRSQESQADQLGVDYLNGAEYDTDALASMLTSLNSQQQLDQQISGDTRSVPAWASTHPQSGERIQAALAEARRIGGTEQPRNRDAYLSAIDGLLYGDNPDNGIIDGRDFLHPKLGIAFTIPQGAQMQNNAQAVTISGQNMQAQFGTGSYSGSLPNYIQQVLKSLGGSGATLSGGQVQRTTINGFPTAYAQTRASTQSGSVDVTIFAYEASKSRAYHFVVLTPAGQWLGTAQGMVQSFRKLSNADASKVKPRYVRIVTVKSGDTASSLAARMAFDDDQLQRFYVLNGIPQGATLHTGDKVKIVTY
ncbi:M48 family metalloprotease [Stakelama sp. CBK3Z-3]|uniref:M48 family metalloprotease n=1 Tax=Stakelama flava TaxID=2860338 RepID=A0ABS6XKY3_9SPHN|nr:M48 family metalloprotease [Stakelama flava]MBW4330866.1 M48 family metalloprotease [Stakelama flava]